jgi:hypothetical protein
MTTLGDCVSWNANTDIAIDIRANCLRDIEPIQKNLVREVHFLTQPGSRTGSIIE